MAIQRNPLHQSNLAANPEILPPERFEVRVIERDLQRLADSPSMLAQYVTTLRARFRAARQMELLDTLIDAVNKTSDLVEAQTRLARAQEAHADQTALMDARRKLKEAELAAQLAEVKLREAKAQQDIARIDKEIVDLNTPPRREPQLTPEEKRAQERKTCEARLADLKAQKKEAQKIEDEDERLLKVNAIDAALEREYERWARLI